MQLGWIIQFEFNRPLAGKYICIHETAVTAQFLGVIFDLVGTVVPIAFQKYRPINSFEHEILLWK